MNDTNGANWVYISDWRHSCHFHSHISTLPIFQCDCQQEPVVHCCHIDYAIGEAILLSGRTPSQSLQGSPIAPQSAVPEPAYGYGSSSHRPSSPVSPEVRIIVNPILQLTVSHLRFKLGNNTGQFGGGPYVPVSQIPYIPYFLFTSIKVRKTDEKKECFSNNNQLESTVINYNPPESTFRNPHIVSVVMSGR